MTRAGVAAALAAVAALTVGCAAIPKSSPVVPIGSSSLDKENVKLPGPVAGTAPLNIVREFIELSGTAANNHAASRAYLTEAAAERWNDDAQVVVIDTGYGTVYSSGSGAESDQSVQVLLRAQRVGMLGPDNAFTSNRETISQTMDLVRENGEWRIDQLPDGLVIEQSMFQSSYRQVGVTFLDAARGTLVNDPRWLPNAPSASWPSRTIEMLLAGPSAATRNGVVNLLDGAELQTNVVINESGALDVNLTLDGQLTQEERERAGAQVVSSLASVWRKPVQIVVNNAQLLPGKKEWAVVDADPFVPQSQVKPDLPVLAVANGRLVRADGAQPLNGPPADGTLAVESASRSADGELFGLVVNQAGTPQLMMGTLESLTPVSLRAAKMTRPTWRAGGNPELWTVIDGKVGVAVARTRSGDLRQFGVDLNELSVKGRITELRLSRDGSRVAAIVDGALYIAVVAGVGEESRVVNPRLLVGPGAPQIADVDWRSTERVVVAANRDRPFVYGVSVDGATWSDYGSTNLTGPLTGIAAANSGRVFVAESSQNGGLWSATSTSEVVWYSLISGQLVDPFYPG